jgi:hypothetical protein
MHQDNENQASLSMVFSVPDGLTVLKQTKTVHGLADTAWGILVICKTSE